MTVVCTRCGALSVHQCQCVNPITYTGSATPNAPTRDLVSLPKDSQEIISEKLSQNDADVVTKRQASEIEKRAAMALLRVTWDDFYNTLNKGAQFVGVMDALEKKIADYREACDYAKSIGAI